MLNASNLPEIIFASSDAAVSRQIGRLQKASLIRKIEKRIYTSNLTDEPNQIIRRNLFYIIGQLYPNAVLSYRSALEIRPTDKHNLYLSYSYTNTVHLGDIQLKFIKGEGPLAYDSRLNGALFLACLERACLENLRKSRTAGDGEKRALPAEVIEERLVDIFRIEGEAGLNEFRDRAKMVALELADKKPFELLNQKISALLSTQPSKLLSSPQAVATALGLPYDAFRIDLFWQLFAALKQYSFEHRPTSATSAQAFQNFAFFEAYFSNYIEGTEFRVEEAKEIVFKDLVIENRIGDTHDIKGTYEIVSNPFEMRKLPTTYEALIQLLQERHAIIMKGRPHQRPGQFKQRSNRAGNTFFVEPSLVKGTLKKAFEPYAALIHPLAKALYMIFVISEIHPFEDGNGRIARVMMNAELVAGELSKIIIPTVYREDYLLALRKLTRKHQADAYIRMMNRVQAFSHHLNLVPFDDLLHQLEVSNAFLEPHEGQLRF